MYTDRIQAARTKQAEAFALVEQARPAVALYCGTHLAFGVKPEHIPSDYFSNPESMTRHQLSRLAARFEHLPPDDYVPHLLPWYGTGVLASAFGAEIHYLDGSDPAVKEPCITSLDDILRLEPPDPYKSGQMPLVLETIDCMKASSDLPVSVTDTQGVLATCCLLCGHERLFTWMYDAPDKVHYLFELVAQALLDWIIVQKKHSGEPLRTSFSQALPLPEGFGVVLSEDDAVSISPRAYREFCVPYNEKIFSALGGGMLHFCGDGTHQLENFTNTRGLKGLHVIPMGNLEILTTVQNHLGDRFVLVAGEFMPSDPKTYYRRVLSSLSPRGLILVPYVFETVALDSDKGGYIAVERDVLEWGRKVLDGIASFYADN